MFHLQDIRYAVRQLLRTPAFTLLTIVVLAGGLGVTTFAFSFLYTAMVRPIPVPDGDRIVRLSPTIYGFSTMSDLADVRLLRENMRTVTEMAAFGKREVLLGRKGEARTANATLAEPALFAIARTSPMMGRTFDAADMRADAAPVVVLSHATWRGSYRDDPNILDSLLVINGVATRVIGVMPEGYGFPVAQEMWLPMPEVLLNTSRHGREFGAIIARLVPGATHDQASAEGSVLMRNIVAERDSAALRTQFPGMVAQSLPEAQIGDERNVAFTALNALAVLVLLLALTNVSMLLLARASERTRETAVRIALGASTSRLVVQGMWEGVILCVIGGALGTAGVAAALSLVTRWTQANLAENMAFWWVWRLDHVAIISAAAFSAFAIVVLGALVSLRAARINVREVMQDGGARTGSRRDGRVARTMVVSQVTAVTVLMFIGVLSGVVANRVVHIDPGFDPVGLLQTAFVPSTEQFPDHAARRTAYAEVHRKLGEHPGVQQVMLRDRVARKGARGSDITARSTGDQPAHSVNIVALYGDPATMNIALVEGRLFGDADNMARERVALVSASTARALWRGRSPIGDEIRTVTANDSVVWRTVVGVVSDLPYGNPLARDRSNDAVYVPLLQETSASAEVVARARASEGSAREALYETFQQVNAGAAPQYIHRVEELMEKSSMIAIGLTRLLGGCFVFALVLAIAGTYGLMSRSVALRTREIGVRRALGASDAAATRMVISQAARQLGIGTIVALPLLALAGVGIVRVIELEPSVVAIAAVGVSATILALVLAATWLPTRKVVAVELVDALGRE